MLTADGCRARRARFLAELKPTSDLLLADPVHLRWLAGVNVSPFSYSADFGPLLLLGIDGSTLLIHDDRLKGGLNTPHVDRVEVVPWYDGKSPGKGLRRSVLLETVEKHGKRVHDTLADPMARDIFEVMRRVRRAKDLDEIDLLKLCMQCGEAGHAWARSHVQAGMTELQVYQGVAMAAIGTARMPVITYGDFAVSPGSARRGGPPTDRILAEGDMLILDFSVVIDGYRSDFTNTLVVGGQVNDEQQRLYDRCRQAMEAGESTLKAGVACRSVERAVREVFEQANLAGHFPHHAGHGLGASHPEAPFFVEHADETLVVGDVVTLEPGLYVDGIGGIRIEHNYRITDTGFERLSNHLISLV